MTDTSPIPITVFSGEYDHTNIGDLKNHLYGPGVIPWAAYSWGHQGKFVVTIHFVEDDSLPASPWANQE